MLPPRLLDFGCCAAGRTVSLRRMHGVLHGKRVMMDHVDENAPLRRSVTIDEVGNIGVFPC